MDWVLVVMFVAGALLTIHGGRLLWSKRYEKMMYEKGIWARGRAFFRSEADAQKFSKQLFGLQAFLGGLMFIAFVLLTIFDLWGPIEDFMISEWP
jgi:hypothetical protein